MPRSTRDPGVAATALAAGHLAVLPTETVYGLAADARNRDAVRACFEAKGRPAWHPVIVHILDAAAVDDWAVMVSPSARRLASALWPGPLTIVVPARDEVDPQVTGARGTVALRSPACDVFAAVLGELSRLRGFRVGVAAPSANRFGAVSPTTAGQAHRAIGRWLRPSDVILDGGPTRVGVESAVVDCTGDRVRVLRPGAVGVGQIKDVLGPDQVDPSTGPMTAPTPGGLASHYAPRARVELIDPPGVAQASSRLLRDQSVRVGLIAPAVVPSQDGLLRLAAPRDATEFARGLYGWLHECDDLGLDVVLVVPPEPSDGGPLAVAVLDRLRRAASVRTPPRSPGA